MKVDFVADAAVWDVQIWRVAWRAPKNSVVAAVVAVAAVVVPVLAAVGVEKGWTEVGSWIRPKAKKLCQGPDPEN